MTIWTEAQDQQLKALYAEGLSCSSISSRMACGFSRNAVIGRIHRMGLERRGKNGNYNGSGRGPVLRSAEAKSKPRVRIARANANSTVHRLFLTREPLELKALRCAEIVPLLIGLLDLQEHHCRWPYDHAESPTAYCGHGKVEGHSYCGPHANLSRGQGTPSERAASTAPSLVPALAVV